MKKSKRKPLRDITTYIDDPNTFLPKWFPKLWILIGILSVIIFCINFFKIAF